MEMIEIRVDQAFLLLIAKLRYVTPTEQEVRTPEFYALMEYVRRNLTSPHARTTLVPQLPKVTQRVPGTNDPDYTAWRMIVDEKVDELLMKKFPLEMDRPGGKVAEIIEDPDKDCRGDIILRTEKREYILRKNVLNAFPGDVVREIRARTSDDVSFQGVIRDYLAG